ncbi:class I SAM-dependent methyltransferase, partial [Candidatus Parcubacteria bacterium]
MSEPDDYTASETYRKRFAGPVGAWFLAIQADAVRRVLQGLKIRTVLDVGGGHAQLTGPLCDAGYEVLTTGSSVRAGHLFQGRAEGRGYVASSCMKLPFRTGTFDAVVSVRMMAHVDEPGRFLKECSRVARTCVVVDYAWAWGFNAVADLFFPLKRWVEGDTRHFRRFKRSEVAHLVEEAGLQVVSDAGLFFWPMALHRLHRR